MLNLPALLATLLAAFTPDDVITAKMLGAPNQDVFTSFTGCDFQPEEASPTILCPMALFGQRAGASFLLNDTQQVKGVAVQFAVRDGLTETMSFVRPLLAKLGTAFRAHEEKPVANGKRWIYVDAGRAMSEVRLRKTNAGQWQVTLVTVKMGGATR